MVESPEISVLMTAFNRAKYIASAIESVLASTYTDFELIIVDDGSTDGTQSIVRPYAERDARVSFHQNCRNLGDYPNRNKAASLARGNWLKYVDADDYIYPSGLQVLVSMMEQFPEAGYGLCSIDPHPDAPFPIQFTPREAYLYHFFKASIFHKAPLSSILRRSAWQAIGGFSPQRMTGDLDMWYRLSVKFPVVLMPQGIVWYRQHSEQESVDLRKSQIEWKLRYEAITQRILDDFEVPLALNERNQIALRLARANLRHAARLGLQGRFVDVKKLIGSALAFTAHSFQRRNKSEKSKLSVIG